MDNLTYTNTGLNIISDTINQSISFNCKNSSGKTITGMNITATDAKLYMPITLGSGSIPTLPTHRGFKLSAPLTGTTLNANTTIPQIGATFSLNPGSYHLQSTILFTPSTSGNLLNIGMQITTNPNFSFDTSDWACGGFLYKVLKTITSAPSMYSTNIMVSLTITTNPIYVVYIFNATVNATISGNYYITKL